MTDKIYSLQSLDKELLKLEASSNMSSLRNYYLAQKDKESKEWQLLFERYIFSGLDLRLINKKEIPTYITIPVKFFFTDIVYYLEEIKKRILSGDLFILVISNKMKQYQTILKLANEKRIVTILVTDDLKDKRLSYSNTSIQITDNVRQTCLSYNLRKLAIIATKEC